MYLGIVGQIASGKGEVVKILTENYGFTSFNLSSILHKILDEKGITGFTRADLQDLGDKLRKEEGEGVLAKRAIKYFYNTNVIASESRLAEERGNLVTNRTSYINGIASSVVPLRPRNDIKVVIEGIRNPAEVNYLRGLPGFKLIAVKARKKIRFERLRKRAKPWDPKTWEEFLVVDRRDKGLGQKKYGQQVGKCVKMADVVIQNDGNLSLLEKTIGKDITSFV